MALPNFFMIGTVKSGSTSLHRYLSQHPEVYVSAIKEPGYFRTDDLDTPGKYRPGVRVWPDYLRLFDGVRDEIAVGEMSVQYLQCGAAAAERIRSAIPGARLFAILRQPADRAYSNFLHLRRDLWEPIASFEDALTNEASRLAAGRNPFFGYRQGGFYYRNLKGFFDQFDRQHLKIFLYEEWDNPQKLLRDLFIFLGVDAEFKADLGRSENTSAVPRLEWAPPLRVRRAIKRRLPAWLVPRLKGLLRLNLRKAPPLDPVVRRRLTEEYRVDILKTQEFIGRDLSDWLK